MEDDDDPELSITPTMVMVMLLLLPMQTNQLKQHLQKTGLILTKTGNATMCTCRQCKNFKALQIWEC
jgi:hypothetical protein